MSHKGRRDHAPNEMRGSQIDHLAHYSEANESPTSQFNNGGSTGRSKCGRTRVGSEGDAKKVYKMEIGKQTGEEEREATKEKGTRFVFI